MTTHHVLISYEYDNDQSISNWPEILDGAIEVTNWKDIPKTNYLKISDESLYWAMEQYLSTWPGKKTPAEVFEMMKAWHGDVIRRESMEDYPVSQMIEMIEGLATRFQNTRFGI